MPPLPADSIHARACKLKCEKILTRPLEGTAFYSGKMKVEAVAHADGTFEKPTWEQTGTYLEPPF